MSHTGCEVCPFTLLCYSSSYPHHPFLCVTCGRSYYLVTNPTRYYGFRTPCRKVTREHVAEYCAYLNSMKRRGWITSAIGEGGIGQSCCRCDDPAGRSEYILFAVCDPCAGAWGFTRDVAAGATIQLDEDLPPHARGPFSPF